MLDSHGAIAFCNEFFLELTQRSRDELAVLTWMDGVIATEESNTWKAAMTPDRAGDATLHFEGEIARLDGSPRLVLWDTICLRDQDQQVTALAAIGRDLTYERALEAQVRQAQKLDGIARLSAGIAHDFNNLLTIVLGHASRLLGQVGASDRSYGSLVEIIEAANVCTKLTGQLLAFGRKQPLKPRLIDVNEVIGDAERLIRGMLGPHIALRMDRATSLPFVLADSTQIQQVLTNLATNARDAMPQGGTLTIATASVAIGEEDFEHAGIHPGSYVQLAVIDNGAGMTGEVMAHIFEPFFTTKPTGEGTGLGLSTVHGIVKQSGGHITVLSEPGQGTTFRILLPAAEPAAQG